MSSDTYSDRGKFYFHNSLMGTAKRLREARKKAGFTQAQVADVFEISREAVALWESERDKGTKPDIRKLQRLAELYRVSINDLLDEQDEPREAHQKTNLTLTLEQEKILALLQSLDKDALDSWIQIGDQLSRISHSQENGKAGVIETEDYKGPDRRHEDAVRNPERRRPRVDIINAKRLPKSPLKRRKEKE